MPLPDDFRFSQSSLQDYVDCPRLFYLRYVRGLSWPAVEAEPALDHEQHLEKGAAFHQLVHQYELGVDPEKLLAGIGDYDLRRWWTSFLEKGPRELPGLHYSEIVLSAPVEGYRLLAKYDLLAVDPGRRGVIVDWKTYHRRPSRQWLEGRLQTRVYPYLLVRAGSHLNGSLAFDPGQVEMVYWFTNFPDESERFGYRTEGYREDGDYLHRLVEEITGLSDSDFLATEDRRPCRFCTYRSLCQRGVQAGDFLEAEEEGETEEDLGISLDFEQVAEIEY
jgi:CRISPR/Cas system-associated exonuclease Cas4 (RecB family)